MHVRWTPWARRHATLALAALVVSSALAGCPSAGAQERQPAQEARAVKQTALAPVNAPPPGSAAEGVSQATSLVGTVYSLVRDSSGTTPKQGSQVVFIFSGDGQAWIYAADASEAYGEPGSYSYTGGKLSVNFDTPGLTVNAAFAYSTNQARVKMPFQVFSSKPGSSLWQGQPLGLVDGTFAVYNAADNSSVGTPTPQGAAAEADSFARAWTAAETASATLTRAARQAGPLPSASAPSNCDGSGDNCVASVTSEGDDIQVTYKNGSSLLLNLFSWPTTGSAGGSLQVSSLASDPRTDLDPTKHPDSQFDPDNKSAAIIAPFTYYYLPARMHSRLISNSALSSVESSLTSRGYKISELTDSDATIAAIVKSLATSPGVVEWLGHGNAAGDLEVDQTVEGDAGAGFSALQSATAQENEGLVKQGLGSLVNYHRTSGQPSTYLLGAENCSWLPLSTDCSYSVSITPMFWSWLVSERHANFTQSLVYIGACLTDTNTYLRDAIRAKAYFAFIKETRGDLIGAVGEYLAAFLARPTHSPEEAYYNMVRVQKTGMMIYLQDHLLDGPLGATGTSQTIVGNLDGWGYNGSTFINYHQAGWFSGKVDPGQVWWMLFAGRWDSDTTDGAAALEQCYKDYWSKGNPGGLASPYCNAANTGQLKDNPLLANDVAYAIYLLDGQTPAGLPPDLVVPRWTMDD